MGKSAVALSPAPEDKSSSSKPLSAPLTLKFDYTRSLGPTLGPFMSALRNRRVLGVRGSDGRVFTPPAEYDPHTAEPLTDFVEVSDAGTVVSWAWNAMPTSSQPFDRPFAWALIRLDGSDTAMAHVVDVPDASHMSTGMRVRARWESDRLGRMADIVCFEPGESTNTPTDDAEAVTILTTPVELGYQHSASAEESWYLRGLAEGRLVGGRTGPGGKVYIPPRGSSPTDGVPTREQVELPDTGTVTTFCIVNVPFMGQRLKPPYVAAYVLLDGADIAFLHIIQECDAHDVRMGMRVQAKWKPREEWGYTLENIEYFRPTGEPDAEYDTYAHHL
ncbi:OB-fold nucleic acid binding domain-containing protein [Rhodococcus sp. HNM0569]|uniref:Zn-ribbon domain-containing OB-fold protein n=1 Tax=Rhodococcus sp. HNM0569 TaxID=2716340 RepID=UPI00146A8BEC|nr:OB-fold nucleic acid binding domain-containing protein [Rhodococcus sp. HNM0569]NLU82251.1 DNA-binding protein [Rhodococcus sp. HNM0569]